MNVLIKQLAASERHEAFLNTGILPGEWLGINGATSLVVRINAAFVS